MGLPMNRWFDTGNFVSNFVQNFAEWRGQKEDPITRTTTTRRTTDAASSPSPGSAGILPACFCWFMVPFHAQARMGLPMNRWFDAGNFVENTAIERR
jgi:hypothetical protein